MYNINVNKYRIPLPYKSFFASSRPRIGARFSRTISSASTAKKMITKTRILTDTLSNNEKQTLIE